MDDVKKMADSMHDKFVMYRKVAKSIHDKFVMYRKSQISSILKQQIKENLNLYGRSKL